MEIPKSQVVTRQTYDPTNVNIAPQMQKIQQSGAQVIASFSIPAFTALEILTDLKLNYKPQLVVSSVGSDPTTLGGLLQAFSKGKAPATLTDGMVTDGYLPSPGRQLERLDLAVQADPRQVHPEAAVGRQRRLRARRRLHVRRGAGRRRLESHAPVDPQERRERQAHRAGARAVRLQRPVARGL